MPTTSLESNEQEQNRVGGRTSTRGRSVCDYCGDRLKADGGYRALVPTSGQGKARVVVACSRDHLEELIKRYS